MAPLQTATRELEARGLTQRKGFPESYDTPTLLRFLADIKAGKRHVAAPLYSHLVYDVVPGENTVVDRPDILIVDEVLAVATRVVACFGGQVREVPLPADSGKLLMVD